MHAGFSHCDLCVGGCGSVLCVCTMLGLQKDALNYLINYVSLKF